MKSIVFPILGLLGLAAANAQTVKPGSVSPLLFESTITTENAPTNTPLPGGAVRRAFTTSSVRFVNRDILEAMRVATLLDGVLVGWTLVRAGDANGVGNIYAIKPGKAAVAVPANLLTQPVALGTATTGVSVIPATGPAKPNLIRRTYASLNVRGSASTAAGTQLLKFGTLKVGTTLNIVNTQTDNFNVTGKSPTGTGIIAGSYRTLRPSILNLTPFFPGATVP